MQKPSRRGRKKGTIIYGASAYKILKIIAGGAAVGVALAAFIAVPNLAVAAKPLIDYFEGRERRAWKKEKRNIEIAIDRLKKRRLVAIEERKGEAYLSVTQKGKEVLRKFEIESISVPKSEKWDTKWRVMMFDIPEKHKSARNALRGKLRQLGFYPLQKSAFVHPYECQDEIDFVTEFFGVAKYTQYLLCDDLGANEGVVRQHFGLLKIKE